MTAPLDDRELDALRGAVRDLLGFALEKDRLEQLVLSIRERSKMLGKSSVSEYIELLHSTEQGGSEVASLAEMVTVTETFFFRNADQISAFVQVALEKKRNRNGPLRIVSLGCASGEEPYTLAMALREGAPESVSGQVEIIAADVNRQMLEKAQRARYSAWSLRATPLILKNRYFKRDGNEYELSPTIRNMVAFRELNLASSESWPIDGLSADVVFCRNVVMYFAPLVTRRLIERISNLLTEDGYLFLGHAETLRGLSHRYQICYTHDSFYYQKRREPPTQPDLDGSPTEARAPSPQLMDGLPENMSWFDAIHEASQRVAALATHHRVGREGVENETLSSCQPGPAGRLSEVLELMRSERLSEALALLEGLPPEATTNPDGLLLLGVLLTNHGKIDEAENACQKLLDLDDLNAGAHYLKALCREHAGDDAGAAEHDQISTYLDPTFSMPNLHAGLLAKRRGDWGAAHRSLQRALVLLEREDVARLGLFGGGFSREALTTLCRAELSRVEERI